LIHNLRGTKFTVNIGKGEDKISYTFNLNKGENFYYIISKENPDGTKESSNKQIK
jgi:hypothetical protein